MSKNILTCYIPELNSLRNSAVSFVGKGSFFCEETEDHIADLC